MELILIEEVEDSLLFRVRQWLPGEVAITGKSLLPNDLQAGDYSLQVAITDPGTGLPVVRLAIEGRDASGWYPVSTITVE